MHSIYIKQNVEVQIKLFVPPTELELLGQYSYNDFMLPALQSAKVLWVRKEQRKEFPHYVFSKLF